jgi:hypothetical protein
MENRMLTGFAAWHSFGAQRLWFLICLTGWQVIWPATAAASQPEKKQLNLAIKVRALFSKKCTECHGPDLAKPKGKFGYVLDLKRLAKNPKILVASQPDQSNLWELVRDDEMPPKLAKAGPLTREQKELVRSWIEAGAPPAPDAPGPPRGLSIPPGGERATPEAPGLSFGERFLRWLGKFHILIIHFPIALFLAALAGELWSLGQGSPQPAPAVRFCVLLGAAGAVGAAVLGWLHADWGGYGAGSGRLLAFHRWVGTAAGIGAVVVALRSEIDARCEARSQRFRIVLVLEVLLVGVAGHLGGILIHGDDFLSW